MFYSRGERAIHRLLLLFLLRVQELLWRNAAFVSHDEVSIVAVGVGAPSKKPGTRVNILREDT